MEKSPAAVREGARAPSRPRPTAAKRGKLNIPRKPARSSVISPASSASSSRSSSVERRPRSVASSSESAEGNERPKERIMTWMEALTIWNKDHKQWCIPFKNSPEYEEVKNIQHGAKGTTTSLYHSTHTLSQNMRESQASKFRFT